MDWDLSKIPTYIQAICGAITGLAAVGGIIVAWRAKTRKKRIAKQRDNLGLPLLEAKVDEIARKTTEQETTTKQAVADLYDKVKELNAAQDARVAEQLEAMTALIRENEMERLKQTIYTYANYARRGSHITGEEYVYVRDVVARYEKFGGDGLAHAEWKFFQDYYNNQEQNK